MLDYGIAGSLALTTVIWSLWHVSKHLKYFNNPYFQSKIISTFPSILTPSSHPLYGALLRDHLNVLDHLLGTSVLAV